MFKDNPSYTFQGEYSGVSVYTCAKETEYHTVRYIEAMNWQAFASCGMTKDKLKVLTEKLLEFCNDERSKTFRTDVTSIAQVIQYALKYPIDEHCGVQLGCMLSFIEWEDGGALYSENANTVEDFYMSKKLSLALNDPDAYAFFLGWGIANIPEYRTHFDTLTNTDYLNSRKQAMLALLPQHLSSLLTTQTKTT